MSGLVFRSLAVAAAVVFLAVPVSAQEGHPLDGTWRGMLEAPSGENRRILLIMEYDGENIGGIINPGPESIALRSAELDAPNWRLRAEAGSPEGEPISFEATLHDIGLRDRYLEGVWTQGGEDYRFTVVRQ